MVKCTGHKHSSRLLLAREILFRRHPIHQNRAGLPGLKVHGAIQCLSSRAAWL